MKKVICLIAVLAVCLTFMSAAFAAEDTFVPSIGYKDGPDIVDAELDKETTETEEVEACLVVTSLKAAVEKLTDISQEARDELLDVYEKLESGEMKLPIEDGFTVRELIDLSWEQIGCVEEEHIHKDELNKEGVTVTIALDIGLDANTEVLVFSYHDGQWAPIKSVKNNGDGTVTCVFEHFCPVAFAVREQTGGSETGDPAGRNLILWIALMAVSTVAVLVLVMKKRKNTR